MTVKQITQRPADTRKVPVLVEPSIGHYPEFRKFLVEAFDLADNPLGAPGLLDVEGRAYELIFVGRSGEPFPSAVELCALVPGLEPMDTEQTDKDLWEIMAWLIDGVGEPWTVEALHTTGKIYRVLPAQ